MIIEGALTVSECSFLGDISDEIPSRMMNGREQKHDSDISSPEGSVDSSVCIWQSSMVSVNGSDASLISSSSLFTNSSYGAVSVYDGAEFNGIKITFVNNNPGFEKFPSMRYNVICLSSLRFYSLVNITSVEIGGDGEISNTSLWINAVENCTLEGIASTYSSAFYIPNLTSLDISRVKESGKDSGGVLTLNGVNFIPCNLTCTVSVGNYSFVINLTPQNDTCAIAELSQSELQYMEAANTIGLQLAGKDGGGGETEYYSTSGVFNSNSKVTDKGGGVSPLGLL